MFTFVSDREVTPHFFMWWIKKNSWGKRTVSDNKITFIVWWLSWSVNTCILVMVLEWICRHS